MKTLKEIQQFVIQAGSDHLRTFGGEKEGGVNSQQVPFEIASCIHKILEMGVNIESYLEIGAAAGGSVFLINHFLKPDNVVLIDDNAHPKAKFRSEILGGIDRVEIIGKSTSEKTIKSVRHELHDLLFIDGDHSYGTSKIDVENYSLSVRPCGLIMLHDVAYEPAFGVRRVYVEMINDPRFKLVETFISPELPKCGIALFQKV